MVWLHLDKALVEKVILNVCVCVCDTHIVSGERFGIKYSHYSIY